MVETCRGLLEAHGDRLVLPSDVTALGREASSWSPTPVARCARWARRCDGWTGVDIGPGTAADFGDRIAEARTVFWNGPMGVFEDPPSPRARKAVAEAIAAARGFTVVGGGDAPRRWPDSGSPTGSTTSRRAVVRHSSCSRRATCPVSPRCGEWTS